MIDTHCHVDLHDDPIGLARQINASQTKSVAVTMLPSHYHLGLPHLKNFEAVHAALGMHPLRAKEGRDEIDEFISFSKNCDFIGEIGLDFSREGKATKEIQIDVLIRIIDAIKGKKFVSVHSRGAARELLDILDTHKTGAVCFHYFTGGPVLAATAVKGGHFFSFNQRMLDGKHKALLDTIPRERVLVESDGPFLSKSPIAATETAYSKIAETWNLSLADTVRTISKNFSNCRTAS